MRSEGGRARTEPVLSAPALGRLPALGSSALGWQIVPGTNPPADDSRLFLCTQDTRGQFFGKKAPVKKGPKSKGLWSTGGLKK